MFLPENVAQRSEGETARRQGYQSVEGWCLEILPGDMRNEAEVSVQEISCSDPSCAPIDTAVTITFRRYAE